MKGFRDFQSAEQLIVKEEYYLEINYTKPLFAVQVKLYEKYIPYSDVIFCADVIDFPNWRHKKYRKILKTQYDVTKWPARGPI